MVKSCARATGKVELRGIIFSTKPPMVSKPSERGVTSSNNKSSSLRLPANTFACIAAPNATTLSGSKLVSGSCWKKSCTAWRTCGIRVAPPTITTPLISDNSNPASRMAFRIGLSVLLTKFCVRSINVSADKVTSTAKPSLNLQVICASSLSVNHSFA